MRGCGVVGAVEQPPALQCCGVSGAIGKGCTQNEYFFFLAVLEERMDCEWYEVFMEIEHTKELFFLQVGYKKSECSRSLRI